MESRIYTVIIISMNHRNPKVFLVRTDARNVFAWMFDCHVTNTKHYIACNVSIIIRLSLFTYFQEYDTGKQTCTLTIANFNYFVI